MANENGELCGIWGAMSDFSHSFDPWQNNFSQGLYLAGLECVDDAEAPKGWTKWVVPSYEYLCVECESMDTFPKMIVYLKQNGISLAGAVHVFTNPKTKKQICRGRCTLDILIPCSSYPCGGICI